MDTFPLFITLLPVTYFNLHGEAYPYSVWCACSCIQPESLTVLGVPCRVHKIMITSNSKIYYASCTY